MSVIKMTAADEVHLKQNVMHKKMKIYNELLTAYNRILPLWLFSFFVNLMLSASATVHHNIQLWYKQLVHIHLCTSCYLLSQIIFMTCKYDCWHLMHTVYCYVLLCTEISSQQFGILLLQKLQNIPNVRLSFAFCFQFSTCLCNVYWHAFLKFCTVSLICYRQQ